MHSFCLHLCKEITEEFHKNYLKNLSGNMEKERVTLKQGLNKKTTVTITHGYFF